MKQIRQGLFETNSSSVHSLTILPKEDYEAWKEGKFLFHKYEEELYSVDEIQEMHRGDCTENVKILTKDCKECIEKIGYCEYCYNEIESFDNYWENLEFESFRQNYTTKSGDEIVAFGYYGQD